MAFSEIEWYGVPSYWAFPVTGRSHGLTAAAPGHGQVALGANKMALEYSEYSEYSGYSGYSEYSEYSALTNSETLTFQDRFLRFSDL